jgi:Icc protein
MMASVAFFSDSHLKRSADDALDGPDQMLRAAVEAARPARPDLVVLPGDIADDGSVAGYERVLATVGVLGAPVLATPGNHDLADPLAAVLGSIDEWHGDGWRVLTADTHIPEQIHGAIDVADLERRLGDDRRLPTVLVLHHPPITLSTHAWFQLARADELVAMLADRGDVRIVVSGHLHADFAVQLGHVTYLGCPSTLYAIDHHADRFRKGDGHVGALMMTLGSDGAFDWRLVPDGADRRSAAVAPPP